MEACEVRRIVVIKLGGSVFSNEESYRQAARFLVRRLHKCSEERFVIVVSAQSGHTDELQRLAQGITGSPNPRSLDLLWSTGELRSVALLTLHLEALGVPAVGLNVHETGLRWSGSNQGEAELDTLSSELRRTFYDSSIAIVPGFFATLVNGTMVSLGRGGSDLTAVLLAVELEAKQCELIKDVPGYFTEDPNRSESARHVPALSYEEALGMAKRGCDLVQQRALEEARTARLRLIVRTLDDGDRVSVVSHETAPQSVDPLDGSQPALQAAVERFDECR
jgi:aspartate kinase